jgi:type II secretory pathway pseudopilin PulG
MKQAATRRGRRHQQGYALVMMMFFMALLVLSTVVAAPTVLSSVQREKEKEMVWRGHQYTRGIRMYYLKMHRFPTSLDDLTQPKTGLRFMRQAYKDPMNDKDGSWRLIYVGPNGQLIGSLNNQNLTNFGLPGGNPQAPAGIAQNASFGGSSFGTSSFGNSSAGNANTAGTAANSTQAPGTPMPADPNAPNGGTDQSGQPQPLQNMDSSNTIGGNIIGVGSKIDKKSFLWYKKAKTYKLYEFIWDPSKDQGIGGASVGIGTQIGSSPNGMNPGGIGTSINGASPAGTSNSSFGTSMGTTNNPNPPQPTQTPTTNQNQNNNGNSDVPLQAPPNQ